MEEKLKDVVAQNKKMDRKFRKKFELLTQKLIREQKYRKIQRPR